MGEAAVVGPSLLCKQVANETTQTSLLLPASTSTVKLLKMKWATLRRGGRGMGIGRPKERRKERQTKSSRR